MKTLFSIMSNLQTNYHFKLYFVKVDQDTGGKWLIHGQKPQGQSVAWNPLTNILVRILKMLQRNP